MLLKPVFIYKLTALILVIWIHMVIGLHFWLRIRDGYSRLVPYAYALVVLIPALAYVGLFRMLQQATSWLDDKQRLDQIYAATNAMSQREVEFLRGLESQSWIVMAILLLLTLVARQFRIWHQARQGTYRITLSDDRKLRSLNGVSLLEALRNARIKAGEGVRLACQLYPRTDLAITPLVMANQSLSATLHSGGVQGHEEYVVAMFVDMRGSTNLGERVLAYDVVFILNRFFTELSSALSDSHGHYAQFAGDGLMALYGLEPARKAHACRDALAGAREMFRRIDNLNEQLQREFGESVQMGIGIHGGEAIVGTMGPPKTPLLTAVGDNINIAARLESQTKEIGCDMIVSVATLETESIDFPASNVRQVEVRGRDNHVQVCTFNRGEFPGDNPD